MPTVIQLWRWKLLPLWFSVFILHLGESSDVWRTPDEKESSLSIRWVLVHSSLRTHNNHFGDPKPSVLVSTMLLNDAPAISNLRYIHKWDGCVMVNVLYKIGILHLVGIHGIHKSCLPYLPGQWICYTWSSSVIGRTVCGKKVLVK